MLIKITNKPEYRQNLNYVFEKYNRYNSINKLKKDSFKFVVNVDETKYNEMLKNDIFYFISLPHNINIPYDMVNVSEYETEISNFTDADIFYVDPLLEYEEFYFQNDEGDLTAIYFNPEGFNGCGQFVIDTYYLEDLDSILENSTDENFFDNLFNYEKRSETFIDCKEYEFRETVEKYQQYLGNAFAFTKNTHTRIMSGSTDETYLRVKSAVYAECCKIDYHNYVKYGEIEDLNEAIGYWNKIFELLTPSKSDDMLLTSSILADALSRIDDNTVYNITDYIRDKYYKEMGY